MENNSLIPIPERMRNLPLWNGFPITFVTTVNDGIPDFRVVDITRVHRCMEHELCGICGQKIDGWFAFIGGELALSNSLFIDPAMHHECAYYAARVCPYLAGTKREYGKFPTKTEGRLEYGHIVKVEQPRPRRMVLVLARSYKIVEDGKQWLCRPAKKGRKLDWNVMPVSR